MTAFRTGLARRPTLVGTGRRKIVFVTKSSEYGGAEKHLIDLLRRLREPALNVSILCLAKDFYSERLSNTTDLDLQVMCRREPQRGFGLASTWNWIELLRASRPDIVVFISGGLWSFPSYISVLACGAGISRRFFIAHLTPPPLPENSPGWSINGLLRRLRRAGHLFSVRLSSRFYERTICVSNAVRDRLVEDYHFPVNRTITIYNGVPLRECDVSQDGRLSIRVKLKIGPEEFVVVCAARLCEQKQLHILLLAVSQVLRAGLQCKCILLGDGPLKESLSKQALELGLSRHVFFEGFQEDVGPYLQAASVFVLTSKAEGLPLSILEAMASGLPCLVTNAGGSAEAVLHNVNGLVVPPGCPNKIAEALSYLITHSQERLQMATMARSRVRDMFAIEDRMAEIKRVILN